MAGRDARRRAGVPICNERVDLCAAVVAAKRDSGSSLRVPLWEQIDDQALLDHLLRIEAVRDEVDDELRAWVAEARRRELLQGEGCRSQY